MSRGASIRALWRTRNVAVAVCVSAGLQSTAWADMLVFASNRSGQWRIWAMNPDGSNQRQLSGNDHEAVMPTLSEDGAWVAYKEGSNHEANAIWVMRREGGHPPLQVSAHSDPTGVPVAPAWGTGGFHFCRNDTVLLYLPSRRETKTVLPLAALGPARPRSFSFHAVTADGRWILGRDNDRGGATAIEAQQPHAVCFLGPGCEATAPPAGRIVYHVGNNSAPHSNHDGCDLMRFDMAEAAVDADRRSTYRMEVGWKEGDWGHEYWPRVSTDGRWLVYGASTGAHDHYGAQYEIFIHRIGNPGDRRRLTFNDAVDNWPHLWIGAGQAAPRGEPVAIRINAGGEALDGWSDDAPYVDGRSGDYTSAHAISVEGCRGAGPAALYRTCRHLDPVFTFPSSEVPAGRYTVRLHFAEPHFARCDDARRRMTVTVAGAPVLTDFNPCVAAGGSLRATVREFDVNVGRGQGLTIAFDGKGRDAFVMGIEVVGRRGGWRTEGGRRFNGKGSDE